MPISFYTLKVTLSFFYLQKNKAVSHSVFPFSFFPPEAHTWLWNIHIQKNRLFLDLLLATQPVYIKLTQKNRLLGALKNYTNCCCWKHILWRYPRKWIFGSEHSFESENKEKRARWQNKVYVVITQNR